ncbi:MAG: CDP-diacylglycerol--glycerol-3-phosphate 3-phosphatidyltransferase [Thermodesulfobacteriota bacterium]
MASRSDTRASLTIPNLITLARILLTPLFIIFLIQGQYRKGLLVFLLAGLSDLADGLVARRWHQKSPLGAYLDPLADKLLLSSSFITLSISHVIPPWLTVVVFSRDLTLAFGVAIFRLADLPLVIAPTWLGKWTTTLQIATVLLALVGKIWPLPLLLFTAIIWLTGLLTALSGIHYVYRALRLIGQSPGPHRGKNNNG